MKQLIDYFCYVAHGGTECVWLWYVATIFFAGTDYLYCHGPNQPQHPPGAFKCFRATKADDFPYATLFRPNLKKYEGTIG